MALRVLTTNGTYTTGTWYQAEAYSMDYSVLGAQDDFSSTRTVAVTFANAGNQMGIFLPLTIANAAASGTLTIKLQENTGSWVDRTTDTVTINSTTFPRIQRGAYIYKALTSYAVTTAASTWRYSLSWSGTGTYLAWCRSSTAGDYGYAAFLDSSTATPSSGDSMVLADNCTYTVDASQTWGAIESNRAIFMCEGSTISNTNPAASYTLTLNGMIMTAYNWNFLIGSSSTPVSVANRFVIDLTNDAGGSLFYEHYNAYSSRTNATIKLWGVESDYLSVPIASNAAAGQQDIVLTQDTSSVWSAGDTVTIIGKHKTGSDTVTYTIDSISGTTINVNTNLDVIALANGRVQNLTEADNMGIKITSTTTRSFMGTGYGTPLNIEMVGVFYNAIGFNTTDTATISQSNTATTSNPSLFRSIFFKNGSNKEFFFTAYGQVETTISNVHFYQASATYQTPLTLSGNNATITNISTKNTYYDGVIISGNKNTISEIVSANTPYTSAGTYEFKLSGVLNTATNIYCFGANKAAAYLSTYYSTITNLQVQDSGSYGLTFSTTIETDLENCLIGNVYASTTNDVYVTSDIVATAQFHNCYIGTSDVGNIANASFGSFLKFHNLNATNNHVSYWKYGLLQSTGDGLTDTTVHTSGTGKFALRFEPLSSSTNLEWEFAVPTGNIQSKTMTVAVWCKINNANYYSGTHQMPRLTIDYDNGTTAYAQAGQTTDWQQLFVTFTPTTTYGQLTVTLSGRTDQTTTNAYIYFDDFTVLYPASVALDLGGMDNWANALPVTPPVAIPISAYTVSNAVWEELLTSHTTTGTLGKHVGKKLLTLAKFIGLK